MLVGTTQNLSSISVNTFQLDGTTYHSPSLRLQALVYDILPWRKAPESDARSVSLSLILSKSSAFSSTAHCPWRTSSAKPPNPATISSVELVLSTLQWNWSLHSFCHASTTAVLSFLAGLLPLSLAFVAYRTVLVGSYWEKREEKNTSKTDHITPLFQFFHWLPIQYRI